MILLFQEHLLELIRNDPVNLFGLLIIQIYKVLKPFLMFMS